MKVLRKMGAAFVSEEDAMKIERVKKIPGWRQRLDAVELRLGKLQVERDQYCRLLDEEKATANELWRDNMRLRAMIRVLEERIQRDQARQKELDR